MLLFKLPVWVSVFPQLQTLLLLPPPPNVHPLKLFSPNISFHPSAFVAWVNSACGARHARVVNLSAAMS